MYAGPDWACGTFLAISDEGVISLLVDDAGDVRREALAHVDDLDPKCVPPAARGELARLIDEWRDAPTSGELRRQDLADYWATRGVR